MGKNKCNEKIQFSIQPSDGMNFLLGMKAQCCSISEKKLSL